MRLGLLGGTFNPIHYGHLRAAELVGERLLLDKILFIPAGNPPLKRSDLAPAKDRLQMTRLAVEGKPRFALSDIEANKAGKSYSVETIAELNALYPSDKLYFIVGIDTFMDMPDWHEPDRLMGMTDFVVISRPPYAFSDIVRSPYVRADSFREPENGGTHEAELTTGRTAYLLAIDALPISATDIRKRIAAGLSVKYLLPEPVESFIMSHGLYT